MMMRGELLRHADRKLMNLKNHKLPIGNCHQVFDKCVAIPYDRRWMRGRVLTGAICCSRSAAHCKKMAFGTQNPVQIIVFEE
jgi:hypothetical protein